MEKVQSSLAEIRAEYHYNVLPQIKALEADLRDLHNQSSILDGSSAHETFEPLLHTVEALNHECETVSHRPFLLTSFPRNNFYFRSMKQKCGSCRPNVQTLRNDKNTLNRTFATQNPKLKTFGETKRLRQLNFAWFNNNWKLYSKTINVLFDQ